MKWKRMLLPLLALLLLPALLLPLSGCGKTGLEEDKVYIAVIAKATASDFWHNVFSGVNSAATEYNVSVTIEGPDSEEDYETQNGMLAAAVANGADAIVFSAIDYYNSVDAVEAAVRAGVKVVVIDSGVDTDAVSLVIGTDNYAAGRMAAEAALDRGRLVSGGGRLYVGLVNYDVNSANGQERERGFRDRLAGEDAEIAETVNLPSTAEDATLGALALLERHPELNVLVGFNEWMTLGVGYAIQRKGAADTVAGIGFDSNVVSISMLETGEMDALIVQNPFAMGYLGVRTACELVSGQSVSALTAGVSPGAGSGGGNAAVDLPTVTTTITRDNMFEESSQKTLFKFR